MIEAGLVVVDTVGIDIFIVNFVGFANAGRLGTNFGAAFGVLGTTALRLSRGRSSSSFSNSLN